MVNEEITPTALGRLVRQLREQAGLNMIELARRSGINRSTLMRLEVGQHKQPGLGTLNRLAKALAVEPERLYDTVWQQEELPLPSARVYFRSKYHLDSEQIAKMEASLKRVTTASKTKTHRAKSANKTAKKAKSTEGGHHDISN